MSRDSFEFVRIWYGTNRVKRKRLVVTRKSPIGVTLDFWLLCLCSFSTFTLFKSLLLSHWIWITISLDFLSDLRAFTFNHFWNLNSKRPPLSTPLFLLKSAQLLSIWTKLIASYTKKWLERHFSYDFDDFLWIFSIFLNFYL